jgi:addiction module HigA family antidote
MILCNFPIKAFHPGVHLLEDFLKPLHMKQLELARLMGVEATVVNSIIKGTRDISPEIALLLAGVFGGRADWWLRMQAAWDLQKATQNEEFTKKLARVQPTKMPGYPEIPTAA